MSISISKLARTCVEGNYRGLIESQFWPTSCGDHQKLDKILVKILDTTIENRMGTGDARCHICKCRMIYLTFLFYKRTYISKYRKERFRMKGQNYSTNFRLMEMHLEV
jgi:hypothetical protein